MGNFVFSALASGYLKTEIDDVKDTVDDQAALTVQLASDADLLAKKVSSNCQKVKKQLKLVDYQVEEAILIWEKNRNRKNLNLRRQPYSSILSFAWQKSKLGTFTVNKTPL